MFLRFVGCLLFIGYTILKVFPIGSSRTPFFTSSATCMASLLNYFLSLFKATYKRHHLHTLSIKVRDRICKNTFRTPFSGICPKVEILNQSRNFMDIGSIGAPIILGRCPLLPEHESESMLRTYSYLVCREKQERELHVLLRASWFVLFCHLGTTADAAEGATSSRIQGIEKNSSGKIWLAPFFLSSISVSCPPSSRLATLNHFNISPSFSFETKHFSTQSYMGFSFAFEITLLFGFWRNCIGKWREQESKTMKR
jgi:hypothetical protein